MANTGIAVSNTAVVNNATTADFSVVSTANGSVRRVPIANSFVMVNSTPANNSVTSKAGQIWFDSDFIYVAVANNTIKRAALSSF